MSITLSKVIYENIGSISSGLADFLDTLAPDSTPTRMWLSKDEHDQIKKLKDFAERSPDDAGMVEVILEEMNKTGEIDIAWG